MPEEEGSGSREENFLQQHTAQEGLGKNGMAKRRRRIGIRIYAPLLG